MDGRTAGLGVVGDGVHDVFPFTRTDLEFGDFGFGTDLVWVGRGDEGEPRNAALLVLFKGEGFGVGRVPFGGVVLCRETGVPLLVEGEGHGNEESFERVVALKLSS